MQLTHLGAHWASMDMVGRAEAARRLIDGQDDIILYVQKPICYEAVAYVSALLNPRIPRAALRDTALGQDWLPTFGFSGEATWTGGGFGGAHGAAQAGPPTFDFLGGVIWMGGPIAAGTAVGFERSGGRVFHAALAIGGTRIRAVNGNRLGAGWLMPVDLAPLLRPGADGWCDYDGGDRIRVRLSAV